MNGSVHIAWQCTYDCNLRCIHCYAAYNSHELLSKEEAIRLIEQAHELGARSFVFTGGEPLIRADILELVEFVGELGMKPIVATNATMVTHEHVKVFKRYGTAVAINVPALSEEIHAEFTRIPFSLKRKLETIELMLNEGLSVSIGVPITRINIGDVERVLGFSKDLGLYCDALMTIPMGRAKPDVLPSSQAYRDLMTRLLEKWRAVPMNAIGYKSFVAWSSKISVYEPSYVALLYSKGFDVPGRLCSLSQTLHIMENGSARACPFIPYSLGNIRRESLKEIWKKLKENKFIRSLINVAHLKGRCSNCSFKEVCGGCRARAYWIRGDFFAEDPVCILNASHSAEDIL